MLDVIGYSAFIVGYPANLAGPERARNSLPEAAGVA